MNHSASPPINSGTIDAACQMIGGDKPISKATYYRGVARGLYPPPFHPSPNVSRVDLDKLAARLRALADAEAA